MVVSLETTLTPRYVGEVFSEIEKKHGRKRGKNQFVSRELDLDLLLYDNLIIEEDGMCLPHKDLVRYAFVLKPMQELAGDLRHPRIGKTFTELWHGFDHQSPVERVSSV